MLINFFLRFCVFKLITVTLSNYTLMKSLDVSNILLNENGYFYKKKKSRIAKAEIEKLFVHCINDKLSNRSYSPVIREFAFEKIALYLSRYDKPWLSATKLEVLFGQAQKNLGFITMSDEMLAKCSKRWASNYTSSQIPKIKKYDGSGATPIARVERGILWAAGSWNLQAKFYVVIDFLSKSELCTSFKSKGR